MRIRGRHSERGLVMLAVMFLVAILVPLALSGSYMKLAAQKNTLEQSFRYTQIKTIAQAALNRDKYYLQQLLGTFKLDDEDSHVFDAGRRVDQLDPLMDHWLHDSNGFEDAFNRFLVDSHTSFRSNAIGTAQFTSCEECFARVTGRNGATANMLLKVIVSLPSSEGAAVSQLSQSMFVSTSNLADYAVFYFDNFETSPGTDTTYVGPIYVGKKANLTPNAGRTLTLSFHEADSNAYNLKAREIYWYGNRDLGCDPYSTCFRDARTNEFRSGNYERDVNGNPVFYYYTSNNTPGWENRNDVHDATQISAIVAKDNNPENSDGTGSEHFTPLIGNHGDAFMIAPVQRNYFQRGKEWHQKSTTFIPYDLLDHDESGNRAVVHSSLSYDPALDPWVMPPNPLWDKNSGYIGDNFKTASGRYLLEDSAPTQTLQLGGLTDPHGIIDPSVEDCDPANINCELNQNNPARKVKMHWLARNPLNRDNIAGLSLDFRRFYCQCALVPGHESCDPVNDYYGYEYCEQYQYTNESNYAYEDPYVWVEDPTYGDENHIHDPRNRFLVFNNSAYYDARLQRVFYDITIDVAKLKHLIENGASTQDSNTIKRIFPTNGSTRTKPFILYLGLSDARFYTIVRIINADEVPAYGLTIATDGFVQTIGNFNTTGPLEGTPAFQERCDMRPAAILSDQMMALSNTWNDFSIYQSNAPDVYQNPDIADGKYYESPLNPNTLRTYSARDFRSHPIRSTNTRRDTTINAMLITGNVPNQLTPITTWERGEQNVRPADFNYYNLLPGWGGGAVYQSVNSRIVDFRRNNHLTNNNADAYYSKDSIRNENFGASCIESALTDQNNPDLTAQVNTCIRDTLTGDGNCMFGTDANGVRYQQLVQACLSDPNQRNRFRNMAPCDPASLNYAACAQQCGISPACMVNNCVPNHDPNLLTGVNSCMDQGFNAIPVKIVDSYTEDTDTANMATVGNAGDLFNADACPSCNGNVPMYLTVDSQGNIPQSDFEHNHFKPYHANDRDNQTRLAIQTPSDGCYGDRCDSYLKPGSRFAALTLFGYRGITRFLTTESYVNDGNVCVYQNDQNRSCSYIRDHYNCTDRPDQCGVECLDCPDHICGNSESGCRGAPTCDDDNCNAYGPWYCPAQYGCVEVARPYLNTYRAEQGQAQIVYTKGGWVRLWYSQNLSDSNWQSWKSQFTYLPKYVPHYSGGHENLIRFSEDWALWHCSGNGNNYNHPFACTPTNDRNQFNVLGTMHALWTSQTSTRIDTGLPAYWMSDTYLAPDRNFDYSPSLKNDFCKPPGIPESIQMTVQGQEEH